MWAKILILTTKLHEIRLIISFWLSDLYENWEKLNNKQLLYLSNLMSEYAWFSHTFKNDFALNFIYRKEFQIVVAPILQQPSDHTKAPKF